MYVVGDFGEIVVNSPENMAHVPPQWNRAISTEQHHYVCEFQAGKIAKKACDSNSEQNNASEASTLSYDASQTTEYLGSTESVA